MLKIITRNGIEYNIEYINKIEKCILKILCINSKSRKNSPVKLFSIIYLKLDVLNQV